MGIISDILEYNREHHGPFYDTAPVFIKQIPDESLYSSPMVSCPICENRFAKGEMFDQHLRTHANSHIYVRLNGIIAPDISYIQFSPKEFTVVVLGGGESSVHIKTSTNDNTIEFVDSVSLLSLIKDIQPDQVQLNIYHAHGKKEYNLYIGNVPDFDSSGIDKGAFDILFSKMNKQQKVNYESFSSKYIQTRIDYISNRYAIGFHDYTLAFDMLRQGKNAKVHLESAFSNISIFTTRMATTAKRVLALKMNSFGLLTQCVVPSRFAVANWFFNDISIQYSSGKVAGKQEQGEYGVYIDSFTERFLEALEAFRQEDFSLLDSIISDLDHTVSKEDRNDFDKLTLLKARFYIKLGMYDKAKREYENLIDNPDFEKEARGFQI
jgi:hypothetical protein